MSFAAKLFLQEVKCKKMVLLNEFDDNVAVVATTVASITTGIVQKNYARGGRWFKLGFRLRMGGACLRRQRRASSVSLRASSNGHLRALRTPQANDEFPNANIENDTQRRSC